MGADILVVTSDERESLIGREFARSMAGEGVSGESLFFEDFMLFQAFSNQIWTNW